MKKLVTALGLVVLLTVVAFGIYKFNGINNDIHVEQAEVTEAAVETVAEINEVQATVSQTEKEVQSVADSGTQTDKVAKSAEVAPPPPVETPDPVAEPEPVAEVDFTIIKHTDPDFSDTPKKVTVFGVPIYAFAAVPDVKITHAANLMAQYLDNNEDGVVDDLAVVNAMKNNKSFLIMWAKESDVDDFDFPDGYYGQDLGSDETSPKWHQNKSGEFDAALEEVLHLVTGAGYAYAYPDVFGETRGTELANAMDTARGGYFKKVPSSYPSNAWYSYDDTTCDYACMITEYFYWSLTSHLGAQSSRANEIDEEWRANTPAILKSKDTAVYSLLTNSSYSLPTVLPDGSYTQTTDD